MKVLIDDSLTKEFKGGIAEYTEFITEHLPSLSDEVKIRPVNKSFLMAIPWGTVRRMAYLTWLNTTFPVIAAAEKADVVHFTNSVCSLTGRFKRIVTIQDLRPWTHPHLIPGNYRRYLRIMVPLAVRVADVVLVTSKVAEETV